MGEEEGSGGGGGVGKKTRTWEDDLRKNLPVSPEDAISQLNTYQDVFFTKAKEHLKNYPSESIGIGLTAALLLMRGPRRFLFRHTFGRFQSEEARFLRAEKSVKELNASLNLMKMESKKLLERAALAESDMKHGLDDLMVAGNQIQRLSKSTYKLQNQATDLMDGLREVPGREALKLRAEVASMASVLKKRRNELNKRIMKMSDLGVPV